MNATEIKKVACIGSGVIGSSWATNFCIKGYPVNLYDINDAVLENAKQRIDSNIDFLVESNVLTKEAAQQAKNAVTYTTDIALAVKDVQFMQENGPENYAIKQKILTELDQYASPDAIYASSTSGLLVSEISQYSSHPERCIGAHPYNPPHLIPLVELTKGEKSSEQVVQAAYDFYKMIGKEPIILQKELLGFISNRLQLALYRELIEIVSRGVCTIEDVDKACLYGPGLRYGILGPNLIWQLGGGDNGIKGIFDHIGPSMNLWLEDMATFQKIPDGWGETAQQGVLEEMKNRDKEIGNTNSEIIRYRDAVLLELLKQHKKL